MARKGAYGRNSFRATDDKLVRRYFREVDGKQQVRDEVRALVSFGQINLMDEQMMRLVGDVDVIFCRNVLIYFDTASRKKVIATLHGKLVKGGYLLLGPLRVADQPDRRRSSWSTSRTTWSTESPDGTRAHKPIRILVVDDSAFNRQTITAMLEGVPGFQVVGRAGDGEEGLKMAFQLQPDVITLDLEMPKMDGFSFLRLLMARQPTPVIVISGYAHARERVQGARARRARLRGQAVAHHHARAAQHPGGAARRRCGW